MVIGHLENCRTELKWALDPRQSRFCKEVGNKVALTLFLAMALGLFHTRVGLTEATLTRAHEENIYISLLILVV